MMPMTTMDDGQSMIVHVYGSLVDKPNEPKNCGTLPTTVQTGFMNELCYLSKSLIHNLTELLTGGNRGSRMTGH